MKYYTFCSSCGYSFGRSGVGTETETVCPKCKAELEYIVADGKVIINIIAQSPKKPSKKHKLAECC